MALICLGRWSAWLQTSPSVFISPLFTLMCEEAMGSALWVHQETPSAFYSQFSLLCLLFNIYWLCVYVCAMTYMWRAEDTFLWVIFLLLPCRILELVLSGLMTSSLIHRAVSLSLFCSFARGNQTQGLAQARGSTLLLSCISPHPFLFVFEVCCHCVAQSALNLLCC